MSVNKFVKYLFMLSIVLSLYCCGSQVNQVKKPSNLLNREQMATVISDIQLAEAAIVQRKYSQDSANAVNAGYYDFIYKKNSVSKDEFESSYHYYLSTPDEMDSIYSRVIEILSARESALSAAGATKSQATPDLNQAVLPATVDMLDTSKK